MEKVAVLCRFLDIHSVTKNHLLKYSLAHAFCCFLTAVEDVNPAVATRAGLLLDTIKRPALQVGSLYRGKMHWNRNLSSDPTFEMAHVDSGIVTANTSLDKPYRSWYLTYTQNRHGKDTAWAPTLITTKDYYDIWAVIIESCKCFYYFKMYWHFSF